MDHWRESATWHRHLHLSPRAWASRRPEYLQTCRRCERVGLPLWSSFRISGQFFVVWVADLFGSLDVTLAARCPFSFLAERYSYVTLRGAPILVAWTSTPRSCPLTALTLQICCQIPISLPRRRLQLSRSGSRWEETTSAWLEECSGANLG